MPIDWNFGFSLITAVIAVIALIQTKQQIKLSNKQFLFKIRVERYRISKELIQLYKFNEKLLMTYIKNDEFLGAIDSVFDKLTNNDYLENIKSVIAHPLEEPYYKDFWIKMENMKNVSAEMELIFSGKMAVFLGDYVFYYQQLLTEMRNYKILLNNSVTKELGKEKDDLNKALENLKKAYDNIKKRKVIEKIKKQIKLY